MSEPFLSEVRILGFNFPPRGWAACDGQLLPINQNQALFALLGTTFGGDGRTSFGLPDLRGRTPIHTGDGRREGDRSGQEGVALRVAEIPRHGHSARATSELAYSSNPSGMLFGRGGGSRFSIAPYADLTNAQPLAPAALGSVGANPAHDHDNMQPFLTLNFVIAIRGLFPSRN